MSKKKELDLGNIAEQVNKKFGPGKVILIGDGVKEKHPVISSGSININYALNGGYAQGKIIEIYGDNGSGKTTLALHALAEAQAKGLTGAFIDMEHALNLEYAESIGVNVENLYFSQPDTGEEALGIAEEMIRLGIGFIVFDSVAAMIPKAELEGEYGESKMGLHARMMSQGMRKLVGLSHNMNCTLVFINQTRIKIGIVFGDPTTTTGGEAMKFYASQRIHVLASTKLKDPHGEIYGNDVTVKIVKNKIGNPHRKTSFRLVYGKGIDKLWEIIDLAISMEIIKKGGAGHYSYGEMKLCQGESKLIELLEDNPELLDEIIKKTGI